MDTGSIDDAIKLLTRLKLAPGKPEAELAQLHLKALQELREEWPLLSSLKAQPMAALLGRCGAISLPSLKVRLAGAVSKAGRRVVCLIDDQVNRRIRTYPCTRLGLERLVIHLQILAQRPARYLLELWGVPREFLINPHNRKTQALWNREKVGEAFQAARIKKGWSRAYVAKKTGISASTLAGIEKGQELPTHARLGIISEVLDVQPWAFLGDPYSVPRSREVSLARARKILANQTARTGMVQVTLSKSAPSRLGVG